MKKTENILYPILLKIAFCSHIIFKSYFLNIHIVAMVGKFKIIDLLRLKTGIITIMIIHVSYSLINSIKIKYKFFGYDNLFIDYIWHALLLLQTLYRNYKMKMFKLCKKCFTDNVKISVNKNYVKWIKIHK